MDNAPLVEFIKLATWVNVGLLLANTAILSVFVKLYTEILKAENIRNIGK